MSNLSALERIELQDVMLNYAAAVDERDMDRYRACFTADVEVVNFGAEPFHGADAWVAYVSEALTQYASTQHMLGPMLATVSDNVVQTRTDVQALHFLANSDERFTLWATYYSQMRRDSGKWRISRHELQVRGSLTQ